MIELKVEDYCQNCKNFEPIKNELYMKTEEINFMENKILTTNFHM